jgi:hypothetical protein
MTASCWQYQRKLQLAGIFPTPPLSHDRWRVVDIGYHRAKNFIELFEWLGNVGSAKYCYGLLFGEEIAAAVCYTTPAAPGAFRSLLGDEVGKRVLQLCRGASAPWAPPWAGSLIISRSLRELRIRFGTTAVVAFADPRAGEVGVVYQASNALYLGLTDSRGPGEYVINGRRYHARAVQKHFGTAAHTTLSQVDPTYQRHQRTKKHRYLFVLARGQARKQIMAKVAHLVRPFPRRAQAEPEKAARVRG